MKTVPLILTNWIYEMRTAAACRLTNTLIRFKLENQLKSSCNGADCDSNNNRNMMILVLFIFVIMAVYVIFVKV